MLLSARTESNQRCVGGRLRCALSLRRCAQAACPQTPILRERVTLVGQFVPAAKSRSVSVLFSAHRGLFPSKFVNACFYRTPPGASLPVWCGGGRIKAPNNCLAATVMPGQAVKFQRRMPQISAWAGPSGPRQEGRKVLFSEPPDASAYLPGWCPP